VRTVEVSAVIENVSAKRKTADYGCTMSDPRVCLTHASAVILAVVRQEASSNRHLFRVPALIPGDQPLSFRGTKYFYSSRNLLK
jgi:hypothetical protein